MSAFEICGMCGRQYDTMAAAHSCDHTPAKPSYPFEVFPWDDDVTNDNGWVGAKDALAAYDALLAENEKLKADIKQYADFTFTNLFKDKYDQAVADCKAMAEALDKIHKEVNPHFSVNHSLFKIAESTLTPERRKKYLGEG
jgi:hypothetical protein